MFFFIESKLNIVHLEKLSSILKCFKDSTQMFFALFSVFLLYQFSIFLCLHSLREKWSTSLMKRREYLDEQIHSLIDKQGNAWGEIRKRIGLLVGVGSRGNVRGGRNKNQKRTMWTGVCSFLSHVPSALDGAYHPLQACCPGLEKFEFFIQTKRGTQ